MKHPVAVIGAGFSGVAAVKTCLEEGLDVVCYEKTDDIGGLWRFRDDDIYGMASVMKSTIINTSKEMNAYSDYLPLKEAPNYMHNSELLKYLESYAKHFNVYPHVKFNHEVVSAKKGEKFNENGEWEITVKNQLTNETHEFIASAILVCIGHHVYPNIPEFPGLKDFSGKVIHSHSYKDYKGFENKNVVIIGIGNSAVDMAVELSRISKKVHLSTRRGSWIMNRVDDYGLPMDIGVNNRYTAFIHSILPLSVLNYLAEKKSNLRFDHARYNLKPEHKIWQAHPTVSDELPNRVISGTVVIKGDIHHFTKDGVVYKGEENTVHPLDAVILSTGYEMKFPFLPDDVIRLKSGNRIQLYKLVFPPYVPRSTLAVIGNIQPIGSIIPISELQCRWAAKVFKGERHLPSESEMLADITKTQAAIDHRYVPSPRHTVQVDYIPYMDLLADQIGVRPDMQKLFFTDPKLFWACLFNPCVPAQYRLVGPNPWPQARDSILEVMGRIERPFYTKNKFVTGGTASVIQYVYIILAILLIAYVLY